MVVRRTAHTVHNLQYHFVFVPNEKGPVQLSLFEQARRAVKTTSLCGVVVYLSL